MNESFFHNLPFGKVYLCYADDKPTNTDDLRAYITSILPNYGVELLHTSADCAGALVARRANLGVVEAYGVLVVPLKNASLEERAKVLANMLLDVKSFRCEPVLYVNESANGQYLFRTIDACSTSPNAAPSTSGTSYQQFWQKLRSSADDADVVENKERVTDIQDVWKEIYDDKPKMPVGGIISTIGFALEKSISVVKKKYRSSAGAIIENIALEDACADVCAEAVAEYDYAEPKEALEVVDEKEELAEQIATLIRTYILKYGPVDSEKIQNMLRGKMCLEPDKVSPVVVNKDCKIVLQNHNEVELKVGGPLPTSLYILLLRHPEGIMMKDISDYRDELLSIHTLVAPTYDSDKVRKSINDITEVGNERIDQLICRIRKNVKSIIPVADLADVYNISGKRNQPYFIPIAKRDGYVDVRPHF